MKPVEVERLGNSGGDRCFPDNIPYVVRAINEEPFAVDRQSQTRRVMQGREGLAHAERDQP